MCTRLLKRIAITLSVGLLVVVLFFIGTLWLTLGHYSGNQVRRAQVRALLSRVYGAQEVVFNSADGVALAGLFIKTEHPRGTVVLCHGYRHSKELMSRYCGLFKGYNLLLFDFRGAGQSGGAFSSLGYYESEDVKAAIAFARVHSAQPTPLIVFGVSMGAAAILKALSEGVSAVDGVILDSPYSALSSILEQSLHHFVSLPSWGMSLLKASMHTVLGPILEMNPRTYVKQLLVPALFIHAASDSITNPAHSVCLFRRMIKHRRAAAYLWVTPPAKHAYSYVSYPDKYRARVESFLSIF